MEKYIKTFFKYVLIFIIIVSILLGLLVGTAKIPREAIEENVRDSLSFFKEHNGIEEVKVGREYTWLHLYTDSILFNIMYCVDSDKPLESVMWARFYQEIYADINDDFIKLVEGQKEPNQQYLRYWHGSMSVIRPLLTVLNIEQIYLINQIIMWTLAIVLFIMLFRKSKKLAIIYAIAMVIIVFPIVPLCIAYSWTFYIMIIASIIAILIEKKGDKGLFLLSFIAGILTCYFDFLDTELITMLVPILIVLFIRKEENRLTNFKQGFIFFINCFALWSIAYTAMWFAKWILASAVLEVNAIKDYVKDNALVRINGLQGLKSAKQMYIGAITRNLNNLYPINLIKKEDIWKFVIGFILIIIVSFDWKNIKKKWFSGLLLIIAIIPYVRYLVLANHSFRHAFFTFRIQIITIMAIMMIFLDCLNYKLLFKEIRLKRK